MQFRGWQWRHTTKQTARLCFDTAHFAQQNTHNHRSGLIFLTTTQHRSHLPVPLCQHRSTFLFFATHAVKTDNPKFLTSGKLYLSLPHDSTSRTSITLILRRSRTGTVWFYTSTSNKRAARPKLYTKSLTRDLKRMYSLFTLVRISINL